MLVRGDDHYNGQADGIAIEVAHCVFQVVLNHLKEKPVAGGDEPQLGCEMLERNHRPRTGQTSNQHPTQIHKNGNGEWMFQESTVDTKII